MFTDISNYIALKNKAAQLPTRTVDKDEFIRLCIESGMTPEKAERTAFTCATLGSEAMIGDCLLKLSSN